MFNLYDAGCNAVAIFILFKALGTSSLVYHATLIRDNCHVNGRVGRYRKVNWISKTSDNLEKQWDIHFIMHSVCRAWRAQLWKRSYIRGDVCPAPIKEYITNFITFTILDFDFVQVSHEKCVLILLKSWRLRRMATALNFNSNSFCLHTKVARWWL